MRWSRFKDKDSREIFLTMQQRVFPAIKKMKYGRLPDFDANGELVGMITSSTRSVYRFQNASVIFIFES